MKLIFDIGSNRGLFADSMISKYIGSKVICIEANPVLSDLLFNKYSTNNNIKSINACVSNIDNDIIDFFISDHDTISTASIDWVNNSRFTQLKSYNKSIKVNTITINKLIELYGMPDYTKIDVEGYEYNIISSITSYINLISFEWAEESIIDILKSINHLYSIGYKQFHLSYNDEYDYMPDIYLTYDEIINYIKINLNPNDKIKWGYDLY